MCLNATLTITLTLCICGCGFLSDSYEEDRENDYGILQEIIKANPVLDSVPTGHHFFGTDAESGRLTGRLNLSGLELNDSNFYFPKNISNFRLVKTLSIAENDFTDLPHGTGNKKWEKIVVWYNRICNPIPETVTYLDKLMEGFPGGYWRDSQPCGDSL